MACGVRQWFDVGRQFIEPQLDPTAPLKLTQRLCRQRSKAAFLPLRSVARWSFVGEFNSKYPDFGAVALPW
jgi:hypothetical protein